METTATIDDAEVRFKGIVALNGALGPAGALRFLTLLHCDRTDYVEISRRLYEGQSIDDIFSRAHKQWQE